MFVSTAAQSGAEAQGALREGVLVNSGAEEFCRLRGKGRQLEPARQHSTLVSEQCLTSVSASIAVKCCFYGLCCCCSSEHPARTQRPSAPGTVLPFRALRTWLYGTSVEEEELQPGFRGPKLNTPKPVLSSLTAAGSSARPAGSFNSCALGSSGRQRGRNEEYHCVLLWLLRTQCVCASGSPRGFVFHQA